jgi:hypothetical protein
VSCLFRRQPAAEIYLILGSSKSEKTRKILRVLQMESDPNAEASGASDTPAETSLQSSATDEQPRPTDSSSTDGLK